MDISSEENMSVELLDNAGNDITHIFETMPDYMEFVDPDIRQMFEDKQYFSYEPLLAQLIKELRKLNGRERKIA